MNAKDIKNHEEKIKKLKTLPRQILRYKQRSTEMLALALTLDATLLESIDWRTVPETVLVEALKVLSESKARVNLEWSPNRNPPDEIFFSEASDELLFALARANNNVSIDSCYRSALVERSAASFEFYKKLIADWGKERSQRIIGNALGLEEGWTTDHPSYPKLLVLAEGDQNIFDTSSFAKLVKASGLSRNEKKELYLLILQNHYIDNSRIGAGLSEDPDLIEQSLRHHYKGVSFEHNRHDLQPYRNKLQLALMDAESKKDSLCKLSTIFGPLKRSFQWLVQDETVAKALVGIEGGIFDKLPVNVQTKAVFDEAFTNSYEPIHSQKAEAYLTSASFESMRPDIIRYLDDIPTGFKTDSFFDSLYDVMKQSVANGCKISLSLEEVLTSLSPALISASTIDKLLDLDAWKEKRPITRIHQLPSSWISEKMLLHSIFSGGDITKVEAHLITNKVREAAVKKGVGIPLDAQTKEWVRDMVCEGEAARNRLSEKAFNRNIITPEFLLDLCDALEGDVPFFDMSLHQNLCQVALDNHPVSHEQILKLLSHGLYAGCIDPSIITIDLAAEMRAKNISTDELSLGEFTLVKWYYQDRDKLFGMMGDEFKKSREDGIFYAASQLEFDKIASEYRSYQLNRKADSINTGASLSKSGAVTLRL